MKRLFVCLFGRIYLQNCWSDFNNSFCIQNLYKYVNNLRLCLFILIKFYIVSYHYLAKGYLLKNPEFSLYHADEVAG